MKAFRAPPISGAAGSEVLAVNEDQSLRESELPDVATYHRSGARTCTGVGDFKNTRSLEDLLVATGDGCQDSFALLYKQVVGPVRGIARRVIWDASHADEVCQEVLAEIWRLAYRFDPAKGSALSWVMRMAHSRAVDRVRMVEMSRRRDTDYVNRMHDPGVDLATETTNATWNHELLKEALSELSDRQRQAIYLAYYRGLKQAEIARLLSVPLGTVKTRLRDGLLRLREIVGRREECA